MSSIRGHDDEGAQRWVGSRLEQQPHEGRVVAQAAVHQGRAAVARRREQLPRAIGIGSTSEQIRDPGLERGVVSRRGVPVVHEPPAVDAHELHEGARRRRAVLARIPRLAVVDRVRNLETLAIVVAVVERGRVISAIGGARGGAEHRARASEATNDDDDGSDLDVIRFATPSAAHLPTHTDALIRSHTHRGTHSHSHIHTMSSPAASFEVTESLAIPTDGGDPAIMFMGKKRRRHSSCAKSFQGDYLNLASHAVISKMLAKSGTYADSRSWHVRRERV